MNTTAIRRTGIGIMCLLMWLGSGCANSRTAVFVTSTSLSVLDADTTPPSLNVAYDRTEGFFGPVYDSGEAPPVTGILETDGKLISPTIKQAYATGQAAMILADRNQNITGRGDMTGKRRQMFFGSSTNFGLKLTFRADAPVPTGINLGFKRKEASIIPLGTKDDKDVYPSVFAGVNIDPKLTSRDGSQLAIRQVFATGYAAQALAAELRNDYLNRARDALAVYKAADTAQRSAASDIVRNYLTVPVADRPAVWDNAL